MPTAYSYVRFSSKKQEQNDSVKRQIRLRDEWLRQNPEMTLDTTISLQDLGVSAFRGRNLDPEWGDLGKFIDLAERQNSPIQKGSCLLLERLDRFSRQRVSLAYMALVRLVHAGIKVVVLDPVAHQIDKENIDQLHVVLPIITNLCLAHEQSREKSRRVSYAWVSRREDTRQGKRLFTKRTPAWIYVEEKTGQLKLNPKSAAAIRFIFEQTAAGIGQVQLVRILNAKFPPITKQKPNHNPPRWNTSYLCKILNDRSVIGEFQPHTLSDGKTRTPDGDPIKDYFPRVVSDQLFYQAQYQKALRKKEKTDRETTFINLFTSLVFNHADQQVMQIQTSRTKRPDGSCYVQRRLWSYGNRRGIAGACPWGLDYYPFESLMLHALGELNPEDFNDGYSPSDERQKMHQHIEGIELRLQELEKSIMDMTSKEAASRVTRLMNELQVQKDEATERLNSLIGVGDPSRVDLVEGLKSVATVCSNPDGNENQNVRNKIKGLIPTIIQRVELLLYKRQNRTVIAKAKILLRNSQERLVTIRKTKGWNDLKRIVYYDKEKRPVYLICAVGSVLWSPIHGRDELSRRSLTDLEVAQLVKEWHDVRWVAVDGTLRRITPLYSQLLHDYLEDEEEDFDLATCDWE
jgi:DNA invertase Pin-like site-specific DNA recombinase